MLRKLVGFFQKQVYTCMHLSRIRINGKTVFMLYVLQIGCTVYDMLTHAVKFTDQQCDFFELLVTAKHSKSVI